MKYPKTLFALVLVCAFAFVLLAEDRAGEIIRYRLGTILKFDSTSQIADEDGGWTLTHTELGNLAGMFGTTNQILFGGTNAAPANTTNAAKWISVQVSGETNLYRLPIYQ